MTNDAKPIRFAKDVVLGEAVVIAKRRPARSGANAHDREQARVSSCRYTQ
jgi:hypothetical protein